MLVKNAFAQTNALVCAKAYIFFDEPFTSNINNAIILNIQTTEGDTKTTSLSQLCLQVALDNVFMPTINKLIASVIMVTRYNLGHIA